MTIVDMLKLARRWWWLLLLCPLVAGGAAYAVSRSTTPLYRAQATIVVEDQPSSDSSAYNDILASERRATTYSKLAQTRPVLAETIARLNLAATPGELAKRVSVAPAPSTQLITIAVTDPSPARAAAIANAIGQVFIEQTAARQLASSGTSRDDLQRNIDATKANIDGASARIDALRARPDANSSATQSEIVSLQSQLSQLQTTYSTLLEAQQRMDIAESQARTQLRVAEEAVAPGAPISPRVTRNAALGGALGLLLAGGLALLLGYLDNTVKTPDDVRRLLGGGALGGAPVMRGAGGLATLAQPRSPAAEAYRGLRTNLQFATLGRDIGSVVVTSLRPGDGKTTTAANLAVVLAQGGQRVVLVDGDLRKPRLHRLFEGVSNRHGLSNLMFAAGAADIERALQATAVPNLRVLATGPLPPNPSDVLSSARMREIVDHLEGQADLVLVDSPPLAVSDALILAGIVDGVLLVTLGGQTRGPDLVRAADDIARTGAPLLGAIVNRTQADDDAYAYYREYYDAEPQAEPKRRWRTRNAG